MQVNGINKTRNSIRRGRSEQTAGIIMSLILILIFGVPTDAEAEATHDHADIRAAAEARARTANAIPDGRIDVVANTIDARLRLSACAEPLQTSIPYGNKSSTRVTVEVGCTNPKPWKIYVPVRSTIFRQVIVATRPLTRGSILASDDIILAESDTGLLPRGYIVATEHAVGQKLRRAIKAGDPITPGLLETPTMIRRGQKVSLEARSGGLSVRMAGIAKSDGILGQVIEFENQSSKRPVQAIVRSPQSAEILLK
jgi:flagella basal body P-ring formation protein FlgA